MADARNRSRRSGRLAAALVRQPRQL